MNADGVLVVGYGNALRGDDAVGHHVAELLVTDQRLPGASILTRHQLTPELAKEVAAARLVVLIDARQSEGRPGGVRVEPVVRSGRPIGSHSVDVSALVDLAELLYGNAPPVVLVTVTAEGFDFGADLSSPVASALPRIVDAVVAVVGSLLTEAGRRDQGPIGVGR
jgi:hydrogenase maturation protease